MQDQLADLQKIHRWSEKEETFVLGKLHGRRAPLFRPHSQREQEMRRGGKNGFSLMPKQRIPRRPQEKSHVLLVARPRGKGFSPFGRTDGKRGVMEALKSSSRIRLAKNLPEPLRGMIPHSADARKGGLHPDPAGMAWAEKERGSSR